MSTSRARVLLVVTFLAVALIGVLVVRQVGALQSGTAADGGSTLATDVGSVEAGERRGPAGGSTPPPATERTVAPPPTVPAGAQRVTVDRVVDGDTIRVQVGDDAPGPIPPTTSVPVRLLTIDTPETVHPGRDVECGGPEATARAEQLLPVGSTAWLVADTSDTDRFDRYLRAVWTEDGTFVNATLVAEGLAVAVRYPPDDRWYAELAALEDQARAASRGNWTRCPA